MPLPRHEGHNRNININVNINIIKPRLKNFAFTLNTMSALQQSLGEWVVRVNDDIFYQQKNEISNNSINDDVDPSLVVRLNHSVFTYEQFKGGIQHLRSNGGMVLHNVSEVAKWEDPEKKGGVVAHMTSFTTKDNTTGKETKKNSLVVTTVKWIDGKRKITELTEVENE